MSVLEKQVAYCPPTETVNRCFLCGGSHSEFMFSARDRLHRLPGEFALVQCSDCRLVRLSPRPLLDQLGFYYPEGEYYSYQTPARIPQQSGWRGKVRESIRHSIMRWKGYPIPD